MHTKRAACETTTYSPRASQAATAGSKKLHAVRLEWGRPGASDPASMREIPGSEFEFETELVLLAMGFLYPEHDGMLADLGVELDARGNVKAEEGRMTSIPGVFTAGDMARGQSLVVWALAEGPRCGFGDRPVPHGQDRTAEGPVDGLARLSASFHRERRVFSQPCRPGLRLQMSPPAQSTPRSARIRILPRIDETGLRGGRRSFHGGV